MSGSSDLTQADVVAPVTATGATTSHSDYLNLIAYDSGVTVQKGIKDINITVLDQERTDFDPRLSERYELLKAEHDSAVARSEKPRFANGMQSSVVSYDLDSDGVLNLTLAPTPYLYVVAFQQLIKEGVVGLEERAAVSPNMLGTGFYAEVTEGSRTSTWCQVKGQKGGVDVMGVGEVHSAYVGGSVSAKELQSTDPLKSAARREAMEEQGLVVTDDDISAESMIVKEIETGNFNIYRIASNLTVEKIKDAFQARIAAHIASGAEGDLEVTAVVLVPNDTPFVDRGDRRYAVLPTTVIGVENGKVVERRASEGEEILGRPHTIGKFACDQLGYSALAEKASVEEEYDTSNGEDDFWARKHANHRPYKMD